MKKFVISIGRQFGCGAHEIATKLSQCLGVPYYDKEIIKNAAKDSGFDESIFTYYDERPTKSILYNMNANGFAGVASNGTMLEDKVFQYQFESIKKLAAEGSCIIVGRCADYILRENEGLFTVFLHADDKFRKSRVVNLYGISEKEAGKEMKAMDKKRMRFHNFYCDEKWGDASTYDLCIDVSKLGIDETVSLISYYINSKFGE